MEDRKEVIPEAAQSRRDAVKKMAYIAPIVLSLAASASFARAGSREPQIGQVVEGCFLRPPLPLEPPCPSSDSASSDST